MPNLHDIERRIKSVASTKQITRTMEMVAAAKIRRANERVAAATPYSTSMVEMLNDVAKRVSNSENDLLRKHDEIKNVLIVVAVSDRGLAGGFNSNVFREVDRLMKKKTSEGINVQLIACGKKAIGYYQYRMIEPILSFAGLSADPTSDQANEIACRAIDDYVNGDIDEFIVVYNHAKNAAEQQLRAECLLPIDRDRFEISLSGDVSATGEIDKLGASMSGITDDEASTIEARQSLEEKLGGDVVFEPSPEAVLDTLLPDYVRTMIFHALLDSAAAEQGARRTAMKSATDNANEMVETLTRLYNRVRQGAITTEISEIVGGAAALED